MASPSSGPIGENLGSIASRAPSRLVKGFVRNMTLFNNGDEDHTSGFMFRPSPINESVSANYDKISVVGMSHNYQNYSNTENFEWSFEVYMNALMALGQRLVGTGKDGTINLKQICEDMEKSRRFLQALTLPDDDEGTPPVCLLNIPGIVVARCRLVNVRTVFKNIFPNGALKELTMDVQFEEAPLKRITMRQHLANGCHRTWSN